MLKSKQPSPPPREACDECHTRKIRCPAATGACLNCRTAGRICTFSPRKAMGRPKNADRRRAQTSETPPPPRPDDASTHAPQKSTPTLQAPSIIEADGHFPRDPTTLADHDFFQDFSINASKWFPNTAFYEHQIISNTPYESHFTSDTLDSSYQERAASSYTKQNHFVDSTSSLNNLFDPCVTPSVGATASGPRLSHSSTSGYPSFNLFSRLSNIQMKLWNRKDQMRQPPQGQQSISSETEIDNFIQTASDICAIAETAASWSQDASSSTVSSHDLEIFYCQLMMSVSAALDVLNHIVISCNSPKVDVEKAQQSSYMMKDSCSNLEHQQSSLFVFPSLKDNGRLNNLLTLTTVDFYLNEMAAVLFTMDIVSRVDGLQQGVEEVIKRSQHFRHIISSSLGQLRGTQ